jgi:hypothetical protein
MSDAHDNVHARPGQTDTSTSWKHEIAELAALFIAVGLAHLLATLLGHSDPGPVVLISLGIALIGGAAIHKRLAARRRHLAHERRVRAQADEGIDFGTGRSTSLWRVRTRAGRLAELVGAFAHRRCDILTLQSATAGDTAISSHPEETTKEFVIEAPAELTSHDLWSAVEGAGGSDTVVLPAQVKDLVDPGVHALILAQRVGADPDQLRHAMAELMRTSEVEWRGPGDIADDMAADLATPNTMVVSVHPEGALLVKRPALPFTLTEAARAAALAATVRHLGFRMG